MENQGQVIKNGGLQLENHRTNWEMFQQTKLTSECVAGFFGIESDSNWSSGGIGFKYDEHGL